MICKWLDCSEEVEHTSFCGPHQLAMKLAYDTIIEEGFGREVAILWAYKLGPHIISQDHNLSWYVKQSLATKVGRKILTDNGLCRRTSYELLARTYHEDNGQLAVGCFFPQAIRGGEWLRVSQAAEEIGTTHRYLRHLLYELQIPEIAALSRFKTAAQSGMQRGFFRTELPLLGKEVQEAVKRWIP